MTKNEQKITIERLINTLQTSMLNNLDRFPESWEDLELRQYLVDKAGQLNQIKMTRTRKWKYEDVLIKNKLYIK